MALLCPPVNCHGYQLVTAMCASPLQEIVDPAKRVDNKSNTSSTLKQKEPVYPQDTIHVYTDQEAEHLQVMEKENGESKLIVDPSKLLPEQVSSVYPIPFVVAGSQSSQTNYDSEINLHTRYKSEAERLKSFVGWPLNESVHPEQLVRVGFVYTGEGSLVQCFQCGVRYRNWLKGDIPLNVHHRCNPDCVFLRTLSCKSKSSSLERPQELTVNNQSENFSLGFPNYTDQATRLQSFKYWGGVLPKEELAEAGFYMIARQDVVRCFSCHVVLQDWEKSNNVIDDHRRHSPNCTFLKAHLSSTLASSLTAGIDKTYSIDKSMEMKSQDHQSLQFYTTSVSLPHP